VRGIATFAMLVVALSTTAYAAQSLHPKIIAAHSHRDDVAPPAGHGKVAPADEYFGRLKMSVLGIRNELNHLQSQVDAQPETSASVMGPASLVEDAIKDWERHYPTDPWLAKDVYLLTHLYANVHSDEAHARAVRGLQWLSAKYQASGFAQKATTEVNTPQAAAALKR